MEIKLENLISYEKLKNDMDSVLEMVEKNGQVVILKNNTPIFIIQKYINENKLTNTHETNHTYTLHEAMRLVLSEKEDHTMHAADLADEIFKRGLYLKKNGQKAEYTQVRARCGNYPEIFEALPGNMIKLKNCSSQFDRL